MTFWMKSIFLEKSGDAPAECSNEYHGQDEMDKEQEYHRNGKQSFILGEWILILQKEGSRNFTGCGYWDCISNHPGL